MSNEPAAPDDGDDEEAKDPVPPCADEQMDIDTALVERAAMRLLEHFDTVQIFVTRHTAADGTVNCVRGEGNYYARSGQVREWIIKQDAGGE